MKDFVPQIALIMICTVVDCFVCADGGLGICGLLAAVGFVCVCHIVDDYRLRAFSICVFCLCAIPFAEVACFLPVAAYCAMLERIWPVRLLWTVPLLMLWVGIICPLPSFPVLATDVLALSGIVALSIICVAAAMLAFADLQKSGRLYELQLAFDSQRQRCFALEENLKANEIALGSCGDVSPSMECMASDGEGKASLSSKPAMSSFLNLTPREISIVHLIAEGKDNREIAGELFLSEGTVRNHVSSVLSKCGLSNRTQVAALYWQERSNA